MQNGTGLVGTFTFDNAEKSNLKNRPLVGSTLGLNPPTFTVLALSWSTMKIKNLFSKVKLFFRRGGNTPAPSAGAVRKYSGAVPKIADLACLVKSVSGDIQYLRLYALGGGKPGWGELRGIAGDYHNRLRSDYGDLCELSLQMLEGIPNPNLAAVSIDYNPLKCTGGGFAYGEGMEIMYRCLTEVLDYANALRHFRTGDGTVSAVALVSYLDGFITYWSKEAEYKLARRIGSPARKP